MDTLELEDKNCKWEDKYCHRVDKIVKEEIKNSNFDPLYIVVYYGSEITKIRIVKQKRIVISELKWGNYIFVIYMLIF